MQPIKRESDLTLIITFSQSNISNIYVFNHIPIVHYNCVMHTQLCITKWLLMMTWALGHYLQSTLWENRALNLRNYYIKKNKTALNMNISGLYLIVVKGSSLTLTCSEISFAYVKPFSISAWLIGWLSIISHVFVSLHMQMGFQFKLEWRNYPINGWHW